MDANKKRNYYTSNYYDGSAVRKLNTVPEIGREQEVIRRREQKHAPKAKPRRNPAINLVTFLMLTVAMGVTLYTTVSYLKVQSDVATLNKSISSTEVKIAKLSADNDADLSKINSSIDLENIFNVAMNELGMVFPNKNKVVNYKTAISEYVRQYDTVPKANAEDLLDKLFK